jgi:hypothetical protein
MAPRIDGAAADYPVSPHINLMNREQDKGVDLLTTGEEVIRWSENKVRTSPRTLLRSYGAVPASVALHRGWPRTTD